MKSWPYYGDGKLEGTGRNTRIIHVGLLYDNPSYPAQNSEKEKQLEAALNAARGILASSPAVRFYASKRYWNQVHDLWFEGRPGKELREVRRKVEELLKDFNVRAGYP